MVGTPNIKITTDMIDEFTSPIKNNVNTYLKVNENGQFIYMTPEDVAIDIASQNTQVDITLAPWEPNTIYGINTVVLYNNSIFRCLDNHLSGEEIDISKWQLVCGYFKSSKFVYDETHETNSIQLDTAVPMKEAISINLNNLVLQSNNYELSDDGLTVTFNEPVAPGTNIEVITYGNMVVPTNVSQIVSKSFVTTSPNETTFELGEKVLLKELITVNIENTVIMNSEWDLNEDSDAVILKNPVDENTRIQISWFNNLEVELSATFTPVLNKVGRDTTLSWTNDKGLQNPADTHIYDGVTFEPAISKVGTETTISWTNDGDLDNPENVIIKDGATFIPSVTNNPHESIISWSNDVGLPNPDDISIYTNYAQRIVDSFTATEGQTQFVATHEIYDKSVLSVNVGNTELTSTAYSLGEDKKTVTLVNGLSEGDLVDLKYFYNLNFGTKGITFTPEVTPIENGYTLSWSNDGEMENPESVNIMSGTGINAKGIWSAETIYNKGDYVTFEDDTATYGYVGIVDEIPAGTALTDTTYWSEMYKILKTYIAATMIDWGE